MGDYVDILDALPAEGVKDIFALRNRASKLEAIRSIVSRFPNIEEFKKRYPQAFANLTDGFVLMHPGDLRSWEFRSRDDSTRVQV